MTYADFYRSSAHTDECPPRMIWTRASRWIGIALFGLFCYSAGCVTSTAYYKVTHLWHVVGTETSGKTTSATP